MRKATRFEPRFDANGLVTAVVTDRSGTVLMLAMMNAEALKRTLATGEAHFWSRSRGELWHKGAMSGNVLDVQEVRVDCDQDALWLVAEPQRKRRRLSYRAAILLLPACRAGRHARLRMTRHRVARTRALSNAGSVGRGSDRGSALR